MEIGRGYLYLIKNSRNQNPYGLIEDVFVEETHRGKGIGTKIIKKLLDEAERNKCYKVLATSRYEREKVHKLYARLGFREHGKEFRLEID